MSFEQKLRIWMPVYRKLNKAKILNSRVTKLIPLKARREMYMKTVVKATEKYHKLLQAYARKYKIN